jgi:hypothetical protein
MVLQRLGLVKPSTIWESHMALTRCMPWPSFCMRTCFGETGIGEVNHSLGNIRCSEGYSCQYGFRSYATWTDGYQDWYALILNGYVKGQITDAIVGHPCVTVEEIVPVYAPSSDHNDVGAYIAAIEHAVQRWRSGHVWM